MLNYLKLVNTGPAPVMEFEPMFRTNLITGDNGLGKSFLLDTAWWALTRTWIHGQARPTDPARPAEIAFEFDSRVKKLEYASKFERSLQAWIGKAGRPANPGLVIYAQIDGGFSVWDPARNYWRKKGNVDVQDRPPAFLFQPDDVWNGIELKTETGAPKWLCEGLLRDWAAWQREGNRSFKQLSAVLKGLSSDPQEILAPGELTSLDLDDSRLIPTLKMPYGQDVPIVHASAGVKRIVALAYLLVWTWQEHRRASKLLGQEPARQIIFLVDEIESHLHPKWQRRIVPALLKVMQELTGEHDIPVQLLAVTHAPLVLASLEPYFDPEQDAVWELNLKDSSVTLEKSIWERKGEADNWLTSSVFELKYPRSFEAEQVLLEVEKFLEGNGQDKVAARKLNAKLQGVLSDIDPYWIRWRYLGEKQGWLAP